MTGAEFALTLVIVLLALASTWNSWQERRR